ncbi:hypothetical protein MKW98_027264 [Papaver atlanticum]|uniref:Glutamate receptor n=1 Tax=Papaver atlanticum TaxID=357466 RepID=A0AAD4SSC1_9MAGN|nr:hypothetical protein MKW98_027264 [Papaver atlanticum]
MAVSQNTTTTIPFDVGVILDFSSSVEMTSMVSITIALTDFYATHNFYKTRIVLHTRDSKNDNVHAASAALDLMRHKNVKVIIVPERSVQTSFVVDLGEKAQVPIIYFPAFCPSVSSSRSSNYFIRTSQKNETSQARAITAIIQGLAWKEIVFIHEDTEYGNGFRPYLISAFQEFDAQVPFRTVISPSATDAQILMELDKLMKLQPRVFIVHMKPSLGSRLFLMAQEANMMSEGYAWIITDSMTNFLNSMNSSVIKTMQGVIGVSPYVPESKELHTLRIKWRRKVLREDTSGTEIADLSIHDLWAYDTIWALAMTAEKFRFNIDTPFQRPEPIDNSDDIAATGVSLIGPKLLQRFHNIRFKGMCGKFHLINGQLQTSVFEIVNVIGKGSKQIGFWTPTHGISRNLSNNNNLSSVYSTSISTLGGVIWPGDSTNVPRGWDISSNGRTLRIIVPLRTGFSDFVKAEINETTNITSVSGYSIDVFNAVMNALPYTVPYEFVPMFSDSYDDMLYQFDLQKFDGVVGDLTIMPKRSLNVDFTLPYTESGISMIVRIKDDEKKNPWVFLKPLSLELWLSALGVFTFTGSVIWVLEHQINGNFRGSISKQLVMIFWFAFSTVVFAHREKVRNDLSRLVLIIWVFVVLVLTSSYTASLSSTLTINQLAVNDLRNGEYIGYQSGSYVKNVLKKLGFDESKLRAYYNEQEYAEALSKGSQKGGVGAIFDEIPYLRLFLSKYCDRYAMIGPTYNTNGFGFVFRKGSLLVGDVSKAITAEDGMDRLSEINLHWFRNQTSCQQPGSTTPLTGLTTDSFRGLFLMSVVTSGFALFIYFYLFLRDNTDIWKNSAGSAENDSIKQRVVNLAIRFYHQADNPITNNIISAADFENEARRRVMDEASGYGIYTSVTDDNIFEDSHQQDVGISSPHYALGGQSFEINLVV